MDWIQSLVSQKKNRYIEGEHNLDLTYITERIIAMSYPASGFESLYRNSIKKVAKIIEYEIYPAEIMMKKYLGINVHRIQHEAINGKTIIPPNYNYCLQFVMKQMSIQIKIHKMQQLPIVQQERVELVQLYVVIYYIVEDLIMYKMYQIIMAQNVLKQTKIIQA